MIEISTAGPDLRLFKPNAVVVENTLSVRIDYEFVEEPVVGHFLPLLLLDPEIEGEGEHGIFLGFELDDQSGTIGSDLPSDLAAVELGGREIDLCATSVGTDDLLEFGEVDLSGTSDVDSSDLADSSEVKP